MTKLLLPASVLLCACNTSVPGTCGNNASATAFSIVVNDLEVTADRADGTAWDIDGSNADLLVCVGPDLGVDPPGDYWACSAESENTSSVTIGAVYEGIVDPGETIAIDVYDSDLLGYDYVGGLALTVDNLRQDAGCGSMSFFTDAVVNLTYSVEVL